MSIYRFNELLKLNLSLVSLVSNYILNASKTESKNHHSWAAPNDLLKMILQFKFAWPRFLVAFMCTMGVGMQCSIVLGTVYKLCHLKISIFETLPTSVLK